MKALGIIFAFYILFLSVQPGLKGIANLAVGGTKTEACCGGSCEPIEKEPSGKSSDQQEGNCNSACNPFQVCKNCMAFTSDFLTQNFTTTIIFAKPKADNREKLPHQITLDFWQPPKIA